MTGAPDPAIRRFVQGWLAKGDVDLAAAEALLEATGEDHFPSAFHAQQAAEKYLKALLVARQVPFPKTHNIAQLLDLATAPETPAASELEAAAMLTPFGTDFRYPGGEALRRELAAEALQQARHVRRSVRQWLRWADGPDD